MKAPLHRQMPGDSAVRLVQRLRHQDRDIAEVSCLPDLNEHMPTTKSGANVR